MASPLPTGKQSVSLAPSSADGSPFGRVSRIRRDPPPAQPREATIAERDERDSRMVALGIITFALALVVIGAALMNYAGWSPRQYSVTVRVTT